MSITETIQTRWTDLSYKARCHIEATRLEILNRYALYEDNQWYDEVEAESLEAAMQEAKDRFDASVYEGEETCYIDIEARNVYTDERASVTMTVEPSEPACEDGHEHDWRSPHSVLGGIEENPGVWGHGGGVIVREVCAHCGAYKVTDTWAQRPDGGEQGLTSVAYEQADEDSLEWVAARSARRMCGEVEAIVGDVDGSGDIGIIVREALREDPDATAEEIAAIVRAARHEAQAPS